MNKIQEFDTKVIEIIQETPETKTFRFNISQKDFGFLPGQFVMLTVNIPGKGPITRAYSIASSPLDSNLDLTIKKMEEGVLSKYLFEQAKAGDTFKIKGPYGLFVLNEQAKRIVLIAAGSGIAPFRSIWRYILQKGLPIKVTLIFSSKTEEYIAFRREMDEIQNSGIKIVHTLTRNQDPNWKGYSRRIDREMLFEIIKDFSNTLFYICGPPPMCHGAADALKELGVLEKFIKMEKFD